MDSFDISELVRTQRAFFSTGKTKDVEFRRNHLLALKQKINQYEKQIIQALHEDLGKSEFEAFATEIGIIQAEITYMIKHMRRWAKTKRVHTPITSFWSKSRVQPEPYGCVLIISPWNYPFQLALVPMATAICAGNCVTLKPSSSSPATSAVIAKMLTEVFPAGFVSVVCGGHENHDALLSQKFDYIFFTGSVSVGKKIMAAAAQNLTPVCLELGGKSPCIVDETCDVETAARRIIWGKLLNAGQTCVAPDYILVHAKIKHRLVQAMLKYILQFYGDTPLDPESILPAIINQRHFLRLISLCDGSNPNNGKVLRAATSTTYPAYDAGTRKMAPVILDEPKTDSPAMTEEIFGPVLPVISVQDMEEAIAFVAARPEPLALYLFTKDKKLEKSVVKNLRYGGGCINDTVMHLTSPYMGFGGIGNSGMGSYHGKTGFDTFTHYKSILKTPASLDFPFRYPSCKNNIQLAKMFMK